ncbi:peptide chain release factor N(5)-glutamine methyltransferase [bacterium]|nr:peptide chain release factor N(5)-glutamine methyltransferase [bacterium]
MSGQADIWTVRDVLNWTAHKFAGLELPTPLLDAQLLIGSVLSLSKVEIYTQLDRPLLEDERTQLRDLVRRRLSGEPVAYLLNQKFWHDLDLFVDRRVLVPRPETETLLDLVLAVCRHETRKPKRILDVCTGSGCLAIALGKAFPSAEVVALDISPDALQIAQMNCQRNRISNVELILADACLPATYSQLLNKGRFDIVVSNPPYVSESEWQNCDVSVKDFEPRIALVGGEQGWVMPARLLQTLSSSGVLSGAGIIALELGISHPEALSSELNDKLHFSFSNPMQVLACQRPVWEFPREQFFAIKDYSQRSRYLFFVGPQPAE